MSNQWFYNPNYPPPPVSNFNIGYPQQENSNNWNNNICGSYGSTPCAPPVSFNVPPPSIIHNPPPMVYNPILQSDYTVMGSYSQSEPEQYNRYTSSSNYTSYNSSVNSSHTNYNYSDELESYKNSKANFERKYSDKHYDVEIDRTSYKSKTRSRCLQRSR